VSYRTARAIQRNHVPKNKQKKKNKKTKKPKNQKTKKPKNQKTQKTKKNKQKKKTKKKRKKRKEKKRKEKKRKEKEMQLASRHQASAVSHESGLLWGKGAKWAMEMKGERERSGGSAFYLGGDIATSR
jgi:outer membrane biosynthesis protein TonB